MLRLSDVAIHAYRGEFYLFGTLSAERAKRGTQLFVADSPLGPFQAHTDGAATPQVLAGVALPAFHSPLPIANAGDHDIAGVRDICQDKRIADAQVGHIDQSGIVRQSRGWR